ncbi:MAG: hypothetical protein OSB75_05735 [Dehalococcoidia bacterium]|nr:hypothetical protein [Dehalococcoidia bacterium]
MTVHSSRLSSVLPKKNPTAHSNVGITMDLYSHVIPDMQDELADAVADV